MLKRRICIIAIAASMCAATVRAQDAKSTEEPIKIETKLVSVPAVVSDHNGRNIPRLTKSDFELYQDGVKQPIEFFAATEEPINVALLIDTSQSTRPVLDDIKDSAKAFLKLLKPNDKAMVVTFDYGTHILSPLTSDQKQIKQAIEAAEIPPPHQTGTLMRDAVIQTINGTFRDLPGRKAIILLTDGKDFGSRIRPPDLLYRMQETDTLVYSVMFRTGPDRARQQAQMQKQLERMARRGVFVNIPAILNRPARMGGMNEAAQEFLEELSNVSAGRFYSSNDGKLKETFASIVDELRFVYRLGFYPADEKEGDSRVHSIKVKVSRADSVVRARSTYRTQ